MGALYSKLQHLGILNNTVILFMTDHNTVTHSSLYESAARIAMFARYVARRAMLERPRLVMT